jgi:hypothetical protein
MSNQSQRSGHRIDHALQACDPVADGAPAGVGLDAALALLVDTIVNEPRPAARRRRRLPSRARLALALVATVASLGGGAALAAKLFVPTRTGHYPAKWTFTAVGPGELLNPRGTNFRAVMRALSREVSYPTGYGVWRERVSWWADPPDTWLPIPSGEIRGEFAASAFCAWVADWRRQVTDGSQSAAARDAVVISGALRWKIVRAWDPHPRTSVPGDNGSTHPSQFGWMIPYIQAVGAGDLRQVNRLIAGERFSGDFLMYGQPVPSLKSPRVILTGRRFLRYLDRETS